MIHYRSFSLIMLCSQYLGSPPMHDKRGLGLNLKVFLVFVVCNIELSFNKDLGAKRLHVN